MQAYSYTARQWRKPGSNFGGRHTIFKVFGPAEPVLKLAHHTDTFANVWGNIIYVVSLPKLCGDRPLPLWFASLLLV